MLSPAQDEDADEDEEGRMSDFSNESEVMNYRRIQCFHCKAYGHMRYNCPELQACKRCKLFHKLLWPFSIQLIWEQVVT